MASGRREQSVNTPKSVAAGYWKGMAAMLRTLRLLIGLGYPGTALFVAYLTLSGAALSPHFLSAGFPAGPAADTVPGAVRSLLYACSVSLSAALLCLGTGLIDRLSARMASGAAPTPHEAKIRPSAYLRAALGCQATAFALILLGGSRPLLLLTLVGAGLGNALALPPLRRQRSGTTIHVLSGVSVAMALAGGAMGQLRLTEVGAIGAAGLGVLATATSLIRDFTETEQDRQQGTRTLPVMVGIRAAVIINMVIVSGAYLLNLVLLVHRIGIRPAVIASLACMALLHLYLLDRLLFARTPGYPKRAQRLATMLFAGVTLLYVGAQALS